MTVEGETKVWAGREFCPRCGSPVLGRWDDEVGLTLGSFDDIDQLQPTYELWMIRREAWLPAFPGTRCFERNREDGGREVGDVIVTRAPAKP